MTLSWQAPREMGADGVDTENLYVHWWNTKEKETDPSGSTCAMSRDPARLSGEGRASDARDTDAVDQTAGEFGGTDQIPIAPSSANPEDHADWSEKTITDRLPEVGADTVILGIVDTGIALGHRRFRDLAGGTRVISSWQQDARFAGQEDLPCGQELFASEIDALLGAHTAGDALDEETFNRAAGLVDPGNPIGQRDLDRLGAHGTHVLDLAAGFPPLAENAEAIRRQRIIAVNLPAQHAHGTAGNFLAYFAVYAVARILFVADALWTKAHKPTKKGGTAGFPIVINFSYGMQAGPKDGSLFFERMIRSLLDQRAERGMTSAVRIVMPAGNDNLEQGHAFVMLGPTDAKGTLPIPARPSVDIPWRIVPADGTANFTEIWVEAQPSRAACEALAGQLELQVVPPRASAGAVPAIGHNLYSDLATGPGDAGVARVYSKIHACEDGWRLVFLIGVAPTLDLENMGVEAPAGPWRIRLTSRSSDPVAVSFHVQSDQSSVRGSKLAQRSYFDHPAYRAYHETGRTRDAFTYGASASAEEAEPWHDQGPVQRRGSHNAVASLSLPEVCCIGSFRDSDGQPTLYSAATDGNAARPAGRANITASYPGENAPSLYGLLASGARDGSVAAYRGTSMSTGLASRDILQAFQTASADVDLSGIGTEQWMRDRASEREREIRAGLTDAWGQRMAWGEIAEGKSGAGRLPMPSSWQRGRVAR